MISVQDGIMLVFVYGAVLTLLVWFTRYKNNNTSDDFLVANRNLGVFQGAMSIAVSWIWAPAVFICSQKAYEQGIAGVFWFTFPNVLCFFVFAPFAVRLRRLFASGYSFPDYVSARFNNNALHFTSLIVYFGYQLGAVIINAVAGGILISILTDLPFNTSVLLISGIALAYSVVSGLRASVYTDIIQMLLILFVGALVVPWVLSLAGGFGTLADNIGGVTGKYSDIFDPTVAYGFGIAATIGLISGPFADQMFFQRTFAVKQGRVARTFIVGGILFGIVPIILSILGFIGAGTPEVVHEISKNTTDNLQMVGPLTVAHYLPKWALMAFVVLAFAGLSSTLDSAFCAASSLATIDVYKRYFNRLASAKQLLKVARVSMFIMAIVGTGIALLQPKLLWVFLIYGALASSALFPSLLSIYWKRLPAKGAFWAIILSLALGTPLSIYANVNEDTDLVVLSAITSVGIGLIVCLFFGFLNKNSDDNNVIEVNNNETT